MNQDNSTITTRVQREKEAHDESAVGECNARLQHRFEHVFECPNSRRAELYFDEAVKSVAAVPGSCALDYGCSSGWYSKNLKNLGFAKIYGIDISTKAIEEAHERFSKVGDFAVMDAHHTTFADKYFDLVVGRAILHHLDFETALTEICRILRPGGKAVFFEPLRDNPAAKFIRWLTPQARTKDELPLSAEQIRWANKVFGNEHHLFVGLVSVGIGLGSSLISKNPNNLALRLADRADTRIAQGPLKYWMRYVVLVWEKQ